MTYCIVKTSNTYNRPKGMREVDWNQWGVHDCLAPKGQRTVARHLTHREAMSVMRKLGDKREKARV